MSRNENCYRRLFSAAGCCAVCVLISSLGAVSGDDEPKGKTLEAKRSANEREKAGDEPEVPKAQAVYAALLHATAFLEATPKSGDGWGGTGWVMDAERRLLVTNMHVAGPEDEAEVKSLTAWFPVLKDGEPIHDLAYYSQNVPRIPATVIYTDATRDLALIQLASLPDGVAALRLSAQSARVGEPLHSLAGFPRGSEGLFIYTQGTSRAVYKRSIATGGQIMVLESQMPLNSGNSGGPIVNERSEVVAVHEGSNIEATVKLVCMSIDVSELREFLDDALPMVEPQATADWNARGDHHYENKRYDLALADYNAALRLDPKNAEATSNRGWVFYQQGDHDTALAEFDDALKLDERFVYGLWGRGTIYRERSEYEPAIQNFTQALRFTTDTKDLAELYNERGNTYYQQEDYEAALDDYDRAIDKKNDVAVYHGNRGDALGELGRFDEAFAALDQAIALDGKNGDFWNTAGNIWYERDRFDVAIRMYSNAIQASDSVAMYYRNRGGAYRKAGNPAAAITDLLKAVELAPGDDEAWNELGLAWFEAGRYADAVTAFTKAVELDSGSAVYLYNRGDAYQKLGQHEQALADLTKSLEVEDSPDTHALRGNSHQALGNLDAAKADFEAAGDEAGYELYQTKYIRVINDSGGPLSVHLRYYTLTDTGKWKWYPEDGSSVIYSFEPGESGVLFHEDWKVNASRIRLWAYGKEVSWTEWRDEDISLTPEGGYLSNTGRETWVVPFRQIR